MQDFLTLFADVILYPMSIEVNNFDNNPLTVVAVASLLGIGFVVIIRRLLCRM